jgi:hypothetical protein
MKITIEKKETVEVEVTLPAYRKNNHHYFKLEENKTTTAYCFQNEYQIQVSGYLMNFPFQYEEITAEQFEEVYNQVKSKI